MMLLCASCTCEYNIFFDCTQESKKVKETDNWESKAKAEYEDYLNLENALLIELGLREIPQED